ncbi:MAG TPA: DUF5658 family protein [Tepidisphaeraceae bacterium]|nr:DUF5658 family protein [Tepidisphaeraceae bacterium]
MTVGNFSIQWIDGCRVRRVGELLVILCFLSFTDLAFTIWAQIFTDFHELNPLARGMLNQHALLMLVAMKVGLTMLGAGIFWRLRRHGHAEIALWGLVVVYVLLAFRWNMYTSEVFQFAGRY